MPVEAGGSAAGAASASACRRAAAYRFPPAFLPRMLAALAADVLLGTTGTSPIFVTLYRSYSTDTDGASDTTHTCCYGPLRKAWRPADVFRVKRGGW